MIGGKILDAGAICRVLDGDFAALTWLAIAPDLGIVLYLPALALDEVSAVYPEARPLLARLLDHPQVVHGHLDQPAAAAVRSLLRDAKVWDGTAGAVIHAARTRGWPVLSGDVDRLLRVDPDLDVQEI